MRALLNTKQAIYTAILFCLLFLGGCATVDPEFVDPRDPWEGFNRSVFSFNQGVDEAVMKPLSQVYKTITPEPVDTMKILVKP